MTLDTKSMIAIRATDSVSLNRPTPSVPKNRMIG